MTTLLLRRKSPYPFGASQTSYIGVSSLDITTLDFSIRAKGLGMRKKKKITVSQFSNYSTS
jgi:hypothetical protein